MPDILLSAEDLQAITTPSETPSEDELVVIADDWLYWLRKRGDRFLTSAAKFGYTEATLDLPLCLARTINKSVFRRLLRGTRDLLPGCTVSLVEEEYDGSILYKIEVSWKPKSETPS